MARGYPDYFGQNAFPTRGAYTKNSGQNIIAQTEDRELRGVIASGVLFGGYLNSSDADMDKEDIVILLVDDVEISRFNFEFLFDNNLWRPEKSPVYIETYDTITPKYGVGFSPNIVFTSKLMLSYAAKDVNARTVNCGLFYSIMVS